MGWLRVFVVGFSSSALITAAVYEPSLVLGPDDPAFYWRMAEGERVLAPFGYRPLVPSLVRASPLSGHTGFIVVSAAFVGTAMATAWVWLRSHASKVRTAFALGALFFCGPVSLAMYRPYGTDTALIAGLLVGAWAADRHRWDLFAVAGFATVWAREAGVLLALVPAHLALEQRSLRRDLLIAAFAPFSALVAVRAGTDAIPRPLQQPEEIFAYRRAVDGTLPRAVWLAVVDSFGAAWLAVPLAWRRLPLRMRVWALPAAGGIASCLIASDWSRLLAPAAPLVLASAATFEVSTAGRRVDAA